MISEIRKWQMSSKQNIRFLEPLLKNWFSQKTKLFSSNLLLPSFQSISQPINVSQRKVLVVERLYQTLILRFEKQLNFTEIIAAIAKKVTCTKTLKYVITFYCHVYPTLNLLGFQTDIPLFDIKKF